MTRSRGSPPKQDPDSIFADAAARYRPLREISAGRMFGASALKVRGKVFAMLVKGDLVVKLSRARADALCASNAARPFDPGHGRIMKEWIAVPISEARAWAALVDEARVFVNASAARGKSRKPDSNFRKDT